MRLAPTQAASSAGCVCRQMPAAGTGNCLSVAAFYDLLVARAAQHAALSPTLHPQGVMPPAVVGIIVGRDVILVAGAFVARAKSLGWRWPGLSEFFRVGPPPAAGTGGEGSIAAVDAAAAADGAAGPGPRQEQQQSGAVAGVPGGSGHAAAAPSSGAHAHAAPLVKPLYISKVNTCFQLGLVGACIGHAWLGVPSEAWIWGGSVLTAGTTVASCLAYFKAYRDGKVLAPGGGR